jgi:ABC-type sugar transport system ATPase subunit
VTVDVVELLGNETFVYLTMGDGSTITARMAPELRLQRGLQFDVTAPSDKMHFFDPETEYAIY